MFDKELQYNTTFKMNEMVEDFFRLSIQYEKKMKRELVSDIVSRIRPYIKDDHKMKDLSRSIIKYMNKKNRRVVSFPTSRSESEGKEIVPKLKADKNTASTNKSSKNSNTPDFNLSNMKKFILKELKYNMSITTPLSDRFNIANEILKLMRKDEMTLDNAKKIVYKKYDIFITHPVEYDTTKTDENNMNIEREYDEIRGCIVYGWNDDGEALYEPTFGANITPPTHKQSGYKWREVLENRWEQRSNYDNDEDELDTYIGN